MTTQDEVVEVDSLEKGLLSDSGSREENGNEDERVLYTASFEEMEEKFVEYQTAKWVLYSLLLILAWGLGLLMLLYLPIRRYVLRKDVRSRKLYLTPDSIVYKVNFHFLLKFPFFSAQSINLFWVLFVESVKLLFSYFEPGYLDGLLLSIVIVKHCPILIGITPLW